MLGSRTVFGRLRTLIRWTAWAPFILAFCSLMLGFSRSARAQSFTTFDAPGAAHDGTFPEDINALGAIAGEFQDASFAYHGFLRARDGSFTLFDAPGTPTPRIWVVKINALGAIAGYYQDASDYEVHGFLRAPDGTITSFDAPGAEPSPDPNFPYARSTIAASINDSGVVAGYYFDFIDTSRVSHGFVRSPDGTFTPFDAPWAGTLDGNGTFPQSISASGEITGQYIVSSNLTLHGFLRGPGGNFTTFDADAPGVQQTIFPASINTQGVVTGVYLDEYLVYHGFLRASGGKVTIFDAPGAGTSFFQGTAARSINHFRAITGEYRDASYAYHGFLRARDGAITTFDVLGADRGTFPRSINRLGAIAGYYQDASYKFHGFLRSP